jgi:hypothetical protein
MLAWIVSYISTVSGMKVHSTAEHAGKIIGSALGVGSLLTLWVVGDFILGLLVVFSRGDKVITEEVVGGISIARVETASDANFNRADELISQYKAEVDSREPTAYPTPQAASCGFGRRLS